MQNMVALKIKLPTDHADQAELRIFLASAKQLRTLKLVAERDDLPSGDTQLPAIQELSLYKYSWSQPKEDIAKTWDFSRLRTLTLICYLERLEDFLDKVSPQQLPRLETFVFRTISPYSSQAVSAPEYP